MERDSALVRVREVVARTFEKEMQDISESDSYVEDLEADSLDLVELVMAFEDEFDVSIAEDDIAGIKTVRDTVDFVLSHAD